MHDVACCTYQKIRSPRLHVIAASLSLNGETHKFHTIVFFTSDRRIDMESQTRVQELRGLTTSPRPSQMLASYCRGDF